MGYIVNSRIRFMDRIHPNRHHVQPYPINCAKRLHKEIGEFVEIREVKQRDGKLEQRYWKALQSLDSFIKRLENSTKSF